MAGASAERQETGFIQAIARAVKANKGHPITVCSGKIEVEGVIRGRKYHGRQISGSEPYTDVILETAMKSNKVLNLSLKGEAAPSLAGGGLKGIETIIPGLAGRFLRLVYNELRTKHKMRTGDKVPDVYGKISNHVKLKLVVGNKNMGGPIDYMYVGPMEVKSKYDNKTNRLILNGELTEATVFAKTHDLYFRLRARRHDQRFDSEANMNGIPKIYGKSLSRSDTGGRIVVTDKVPRGAIIIKVS